MIDELVKTIRLHLSERLTSPLMGAFVVSWCAWNYRTLLVAFSGEEVLAKLYIIDHYLYPDLASALIQGVAAPMATAAVYLFGYPFPAKWVYTFTRQRQREILDIRRKIEDETPLTVEDSKRIRNELARAEQEYFAELDRKDAEIARLKGHLAAQEGRMQSTASSMNDARRPEGLTDELLAMLSLIDKHGGKLLEPDAISMAGVPKIEAEYRLGELHKMQLLSRVFDPSADEYAFKFTHEGRAALLHSRGLAEA